MKIEGFRIGKSLFLDFCSFTLSGDIICTTLWQHRNFKQCARNEQYCKVGKAVWLSLLQNKKSGNPTLQSSRFVASHYILPHRTYMLYCVI